MKINGLDLLGTDSAKASIEYLKTGKGPGIDWTYDDLTTWSLQAAAGTLGFKTTLAQLREHARKLESESVRPSSKVPVYAAAAYTAQRGCHANGMTIWHFLFLAFIFALIYFMSHIVAYVTYRWRTRGFKREQDTRLLGRRGQLRRA